VKLVLGVDTHRDPQELLVQERHTSFHTESHGRCTPTKTIPSKPLYVPEPIANSRALTLVGTETVADVQVLDPLDTFLVEDLRGRGSVEVEVSSKDLVGTFTGEDHLDTTGLDLSAATAMSRVVSNG
jgi:hypothetical protein